jgi:hypothetical protein
MAIRLNAENSKVIAGKVYLTQSKAFKLNPGLTVYLNRASTIVHPVLGTMVEYTGPYTRN